MFSDLQYEKKLQKDKIVKHTVEIQYKISNYITSNPQLMDLDLSNMKLAHLDCLPQMTQIQFLNLDNNQFSQLPDLPPNLIFITIVKNPLKESAIRKQVLLQCFKSILAMNYNCFTDEERYFQIIIRDPNSPFKAMSKESQIISPLSLLNYSCLKLIQYLRNKNIKCSAVLKVQKVMRGFLTRLHKRKNAEKMKKIMIYVRKIGIKWKKWAAESSYMSKQLSGCYGIVFRQLLLQIRAKKEAMQKKKYKLQLINAISKFMNKKKGLQQQSLDYFVEGNYTIYINLHQLRQYETLFASNKSLVLQQLSISLSNFRSNQSNQTNQLYSISNAPYFTYRINIENPQTLKGKITPIYFFQQQQYLINVIKNNSKEIVDKFMIGYKREIKIKRKLTKSILTEQQFKLFQLHNTNINEFQDIEYNSLVKIQFFSFESLLSLYKCVYRYTEEQLFLRLENKYDKELLGLIFQNQIDFVSSIVLIQKQFRAFQLRKKSINLPTLIKKIKCIRSASQIQKWIRNLRFYHSLYFNQELGFYLRQIQSSILYLPSDIYYQLERINEKSQKQSYKFSKMNIDIIVNHQLKLLYCQYNTQILNKFPFLSKSSVFCETLLNNYGFQNYQNIGISKHGGQADIYYLIHFNTDINLLKINNLNYIELKFTSIQEAKKIAAILALITYRFYKSHFISLFNNHQVKFQDNIISHHLDKSKTVYNININKSIPFKLENYNPKFMNQLFASHYQKSYDAFPYPTSFFQDGIKIVDTLSIQHKGKPKQIPAISFMERRKSAHKPKKILNQFDIQLSSEFSTIANSNIPFFDSSQRWSLISGWQDLSTPRQRIDNSLHIEYANEKNKYKCNLINQIKNDHIKTRVKTEVTQTYQNCRIRQKTSDSDCITKKELDFEKKVMCGLSLINELQKKKEMKKMRDMITFQHLNQNLNQSLKPVHIRSHSFGIM